MGVAAVLFSIVTVLVGMVALGDVVMGDAASGLKRLAGAHVGFALTGVILLLVALVDVSRATAWASLGALLVTGTIGLSILAWTRRPGRTVDAAAAGTVPMPVVIIHGAAAFLTVVSVLVTAASRGVLR
jgi:hypothetical protein